MDDLQENPEDYDFFQAVRLLERLQRRGPEGKAGTEEDGLAGRRRRQRAEDSSGTTKSTVRIRPELSLDYADSDIVSVEENSDGELEILTTFMGLYGISSPLPAYYTEELLDDEWEGYTAPREFLDIIHQHLYPLLFSAWKKYRFAYQTVEHNEEKYWSLLYSLIGLADPEFRACAQHAKKLLPYIGLLSQRQKSILGMQTILRDILGTDDITIDPCVNRQVRIPEDQRSLLGEKQATLGDDLTIGQVVPDRMGKAIIRISGISAEQFQRITKDPEYLDLIKTLTKFYLVQALALDVVVVMPSSAIHTTLVGGGSWASLGIDTWLTDTQTTGLHDECEKKIEVTLY